MASEIIEYRFTETAAQDLDDILGYISITLSNPTAANDLYDKIFLVINQVLSFPNIGTQVNNPLVSMRNVRKLFVKNYTLYYIIDMETKQLVILRIIYSHRNIDEIISSLNI